MRTENLTAILAANLEPDAKQTMWRHVFGINAGALAALILSGGILRVSETMERIHHDEARQVAIASRCARPLLKSIRGREIAMEACERLITLLHLGLAPWTCFRSTQIAFVRACARHPD